MYIVVYALSSLSIRLNDSILKKNRSADSAVLSPFSCSKVTSELASYIVLSI